MYVHAFDGPWLSHPFWRPRFLLSSPEALAKLHDADIPSLIIDERRGVALAQPKLAVVSGHAGTLPATQASDTPSPPRRRQSSAPTRRAGAKRPDAERPCSYGEEKDQASHVARTSQRVVRAVLDGARSGLGVRAEDVGAAVDDILQSIHRNPHALIGLTRLRSKDEYTYVHSVAVGALMVNLGRQIGLPRDHLHHLGVAGLLHDVGKMVVPDRVLNKPGSLTEDELAMMRTHPEQGYRLLTESTDIPDIALDVARHHHERMDGTGYPMRLKGKEISRNARIAAICDVYDALTSQRPYKAAWTPGDAIGHMHRWEGHFDPDLLFRFMQSIGVFPVGMLVRLRSNRLGVILDNGRRASRTRVSAFYATRERERLAPETVSIADSLANDQILSEEQPEAWGIDDWPALKLALLAADGSATATPGRTATGRR